MAVSLNSVISFNPTGNYQQIKRNKNGALLSNVRYDAPLRGAVVLSESTEGKKLRIGLLVASSGNFVTETANEDSKTIDGNYSDDGSSSNVPKENSSMLDEKVSPSEDLGLAPQVSPVSNGSPDPTNLNQAASSVKPSPTVKRAPLTARERLRAARVLNRYTESKPSTPALGSKLLEALRETDKGKKRPGLPEAPTNLLDDSKRGLSKGGWDITLPAGMDVFFIVFSFVLISTLMFATTFVVWKVGAIHFNEY